MVLSGRLLFLPAYAVMVLVHPTVVFLACFESIAVQAVSLCEIEYGSVWFIKVFYPAALMLGFSIRLVCGTVFSLLSSLVIAPASVAVQLARCCCRCCYSFCSCCSAEDGATGA